MEDQTMTTPAATDPMNAEPMECAIWFLDGRRVDYALEDSEADAADYAVAMEDGDYPTTLIGVQFADGRLVRAEDWRALADARRRRRQREQERRDNPPPPIPTRRGFDPFDGKPIDIELDSPRWVGRPEATDAD